MQRIALLLSISSRLAGQVGTCRKDTSFKQCKYMSAAVGNTNKTSQRVQKGSRRADFGKVDGKTALILLPFSFPLDTGHQGGSSCWGRGLGLSHFFLSNSGRTTNTVCRTSGVPLCSIFSLLFLFLSNLFPYRLLSTSISLLTTETLLKPIF